MTKRNAKNTKACVEKLKVLSDEVRLSVLKLLMEGDPKAVNEISQSLAIEQSLLSHHLKVLREQGFVETAREGKFVRYRLADVAVSKAEREINLGCCTLSFETTAPKR
jgi:ArsR family transcriptional regulator, nickel/cobalt-responsive transcriptional repressor